LFLGIMIRKLKDDEEDRYLVSGNIVLETMEPVTAGRRVLWHPRTATYGEYKGTTPFDTLGIPIPARWLTSGSGLQEAQLRGEKQK
jgi:hypothetical protein